MKRTIFWVPVILLLTGCLGTVVPLTVSQPTPAANIENYALAMDVVSSTSAICPTCPPGCTVSPSATITSTPTITKTPTKTFTKTATFTKTYTKTPKTIIYEPHDGSPIYTSNVIYPKKGCSWIGVVGQVFGSDGLPVRGAVITVRGKKDGEVVEMMTLTGLASGYKVSNGFEIKLADVTFSSKNVWSITVYDTSYHIQSIPLYFTTYTDCDKNMIMVNFKIID